MLLYTRCVLRYFLTIGLVVVTLAGCGDAAPAPPEASTTGASGRPAYTDYVAHAEQSHSPVALFFFVDGEPFSMRTDATLRTLFRSDAPILPVYRTPMTLDASFLLDMGVFVEDTIVLVADGRRIQTRVHPTADDLRALLTTGAFPAE